MTQHPAAPERDEAALRQALTAAADLPAPHDLATRILDGPEHRPARSRRVSRWLTESGPSRRTWTVLGAAASVAAVVLGVAVFGGPGRPSSPMAGPAAGASASASTSPTAPAHSTNSGSPISSAPASVAPALLAKGDYRAWSSQTVPCGGVAAVPDAEQQLLSPQVDVVGAVVCDSVERTVPGDGVWLMAGTRELSAAQVAALAKALTAANVPVDPAGVCTADLVLVPDFALRLADGRTVRPGVPGDGCHPSRDAAAVLTPADGDTSDATTKVRQLRTQAMVDAGCDPASVPYWDPFSSGGTGTSGDRPAAPKAGSVCRYDATGNSPETWSASLTALGTPGSAALKAALTPIMAAQVKPAGSCTSTDHSFDPATDGWLTVVSAPSDAAVAAKVPSEVVLSVELGGCHRVLAGNGVGWFAPGSAVAALAALADESVELEHS